MSTTVGKWKDGNCDVYIGRRGRHLPWKWGNPFTIGISGTREDVIKQFKTWVESEDPRAIWIREHIHELKDKKLGCFCSPLACHGDVLAKMADKS